MTDMAWVVESGSEKITIPFPDPEVDGSFEAWFARWASFLGYVKAESFQADEASLLAQGYVRLDHLDVEGLKKAWRYGVHVAESAQRDQAWAVVAEQVEALLAAIEHS